MNFPKVIADSKYPETLDLRVAAAATEYQNRRENGETPNRDEFLSQRSDIAAQLAPCLEAIDFVFGVVPPIASNHESRHLTQLDDFRIIRKLGSGGMGIVFEAEQISLNRRVALKVLPSVAAFDVRSLKRFQLESKAAASLQHPHIVQVFSIGQTQGVHYFAMQLIEGESLSKLIQRLRSLEAVTKGNDRPTESKLNDETSRPYQVSQAGDEPSQSSSESYATAYGTTEFFRDVARLLRDAALAVQHAHERGVIHRDIKPANFLLDKGGQIWVSDFGLAKLSGSELTGTGDVLGTLRFLPPELAAGKPDALDARCDVYALGATLYELLTLRPAFEAEDRHALFRKIMEEEPTPPAQVQQGIPPELARIALQAMSKMKANRYGSAQAFADDLTRYLTGEAIFAKPLNKANVLRHSSLWIGVAVTAITVVMVGAFYFVAKNQNNDKTVEQKTTPPILEIAEGDRPTWLVSNDQISEPLGEAWGAKLQTRQAELPALLRATGLLTIQWNDNQGTSITTGFVVAKDTVMVPSHAVRVFVKKDDSGRWVFAKNMESQAEVEASIEFCAEHSGGRSKSFKIIGLRHVSYHGFALLTTQPLGEDRLPLKLSSKSPGSELIGRYVFAIGHLFPDRRLKPDLQTKVIRGFPGVKRVAPGRILQMELQVDFPGMIMEREETLIPSIVHDCTTMVGCGGAPIIDLEDGAVLAIHMSALFGSQIPSRGVPIWELLQDQELQEILNNK